MFRTVPRKSRLKLAPLDLGDETLGQRLARLRKEHGYTQVELAHKIGIIQSLVSEYERDRLRLHAEMLARFAIALDVAADVILGLKKRPADPRGSDPRLRRLWKKFQRVGELPERDQKAVFRLVNSLAHTAQIRSA